MIYSDIYFEDLEKVVSAIPNVEKIKNKKILITGVTGMICSAVVDVLFFLNRKRGMNISIFLAGRNEDKIAGRFSPFQGYAFIPFDSTQELENFDFDIDFIIHGASNAEPHSYTREPVETFLGNIIGLNSLLKISQKNRARLLFISSSEVYGVSSNKGTPYKESDYGGVGDILNPRSCYPNGKRGGETLCASYISEYGVDSVIVRPGHIYGPTMTSSDSRASSQFIRDGLEGRDIVMKSTGDQLRSYCHCLDCASAILSVLLCGISGEAYNISNKESIVTIRKFAETVSKYSATNIVFENPTDKEQKGYNLMNNSSLNSDKLENLGWAALFDIETGIKRTIEVLQKNHIATNFL